ncbi:MAG: type II secretion system protein [Candidatus Moranbacteria bacterium]|nr:type II secretion system protein [Candidatus Moranbacteria bacterium]
MKKEGNQKKGFTLIEMLVVIFIVGIGLIGALSFFNINLNNQFEAKNELIAAQLAQESVELLRNIVDYNALAGNDWYSNITNQTAGSNDCKNIDYRSLSSHNCVSSANLDDIYLDSSGRYRQYSDNSQLFHRKIESIDPIDRDSSDGSINLRDKGDCFRVTVAVTWNSRVTKASDVICKPR